MSFLIQAPARADGERASTASTVVPVARHVVRSNEKGLVPVSAIARHDETIARALRQRLEFATSRFSQSEHVNRAAAAAVLPAGEFRRFDLILNTLESVEADSKTFSRIAGSVVALGGLAAGAVLVAGAGVAALGIAALSGLLAFGVFNHASARAHQQQVQLQRKLAAPPPPAIIVPPLVR